MFKVKEYRKKLVSDEYPVFSLTTDSWNDYGSICTFSLGFHSSESNYIDIGILKILQRDERHTKLPSVFFET